MKKITTTFFVFIFLLLFSSSVLAQARWTPIPRPTTTTLQDIACTTTNQCWTVGTTTPYSTSDGGVTWQTTDIPDNTARFTEVEAIPSSIATQAPRISIFSPANTGVPVFWYSTDNGLSYNPGQAFPFNSGVSDLEFVNSNDGFASTRGGGIQITSDGGLDWGSTYIEGSTPLFGPSQSVNALSFPTTTTGYAVGTQGNVAKTTDGAHTFTTQVIGNAGIGNPNFLDVYFATPTIGWIVGSANTILQTTDGGMSWHPQTSPYPSAATFNKVHFIDSMNGIVVGSLPASVYGLPVLVILRTSNGGQTWIDESPSYPDIETYYEMFEVEDPTLYSVYFVGDTAYAVGTNGITLKKTSIPIPICGNNVLDSGEQCDDGNTLDGDGCTRTCTLEQPVCGNGILQQGEQCDDGNLINQDGCSEFCSAETFPVGGTVSINGILFENVGSTSIGLSEDSQGLIHLTVPEGGSLRTLFPQAQDPQSPSPHPQTEVVFSGGSSFTIENDCPVQGLVTFCTTGPSSCKFTLIGNGAYEITQGGSDIVWRMSSTMEHQADTSANTILSCAREGTNTITSSQGVTLFASRILQGTQATSYLPESWTFRDTTGAVRATGNFDNPTESVFLSTAQNVGSLEDNNCAFFTPYDAGTVSFTVRGQVIDKPFIKGQRLDFTVVEGVPEVDTDGDQFLDSQDLCLTIPGIYSGCPAADSISVRLHTIDQQKPRTACPDGQPSCFIPVTNVEIKVFDLLALKRMVISTLQGQLVTIGNNPKAELFADIFESPEAATAIVGTCTTDSTGTCLAPEAEVGNYLVLIKATVPPTNQIVYSAKTKAPKDFVDTNNDGAGDLASKEFNILQIHKRDGTIDLGGAGIITGLRLLFTGNFIAIPPTYTESSSGVGTHLFGLTLVALLIFSLIHTRPKNN